MANPRPQYSAPWIFKGCRAKLRPIEGEPAVSADQNDVIHFLKNPASHGVAAGAVTRIETHCAVIFLVGDRAFKLKKAVRYPFLDFSTLARRKAACEAEIALNQPAAPSLYLGLRRLGRDREGRVCWDGDETIDWVVEMRRFPDDALLSSVAARGGLDRPLCCALADRIAAYHEAAPVIRDTAGAATLSRLIRGIHEALDHSGGLDRATVARLVAALETEGARLGALVARRAADGHVRHCHGDLHLANICLLDGVPTLFDALEFDPALATIDVLYDLAFLVMDLEQRGLHDLAATVLNRYLDRREEEDGLALMPLFTAMRAAIRAYASAAAGKIAIATDYLDHAARCLETPEPVLVAIGGLSGSGKSHLGRNLAGRIGGAGGARHLRSDVLRKNLAGLPFPEQRLGPTAYTQAASDRVYAAMREQAARLLKDGIAVICDAVFAKPIERSEIEMIATAAGVPFRGIWLDAPRSTMAARIEGRRGDASDATTAVLESQLGYDLGEIGWARINSDRDDKAVIAAALRIIEV